MFEYRGRQLDINEEYLKEYKAYTGAGQDTQEISSEI